ncbi:MAG: hypothetical protein AB7G93_01690 [Bdellovibrionales bacterium]
MKSRERMIIGVILLGTAIWLFSRQNDDRPSAMDPHSSHRIQQRPMTKPLPNSATPREDAVAKPTVRTPAASSAELDSLTRMSQMLFEFTRPTASLQDLVKDLENRRQEPLVSRNANAYTGEMAIVRTKNPLPGTRYFHAQYFSGAEGKGFVQHMSFEFRPGPSAMTEAVQAVRSAFTFGAPKVQRADYVQWALDSGYIVWIKKMGTEDLRDNPFNAYTSNDVGTIRVAIEAEIH